jgi:hypothetical protein
MNGMRTATFYETVKYDMLVESRNPVSIFPDDSRIPVRMHITFPMIIIELMLVCCFRRPPPLSPPTEGGGVSERVPSPLMGEERWG